MEDAYLTLPRFTIGVGDRFSHQARAQLGACICALEAGTLVAPVWNKSNREHLLIHSEPQTTRNVADAAVAALGWRQPYFCDADHITLATVDRFLAPCDFFTLDVAEEIGRPPSQALLDDFIQQHPELPGTLALPGGAVSVTRGLLQATAAKYLGAVEAAAALYRKIRDAKGEGTFVTEVSMDETDAPQTPAELLIILAAMADFGIPVQTIAPKFTGRFNKGVEYAGELAQFAREFSDDLAVIAHAVRRYGLPAGLKLSIHSGSDKFSLYRPIREALRRSGAGVHIKTAGTTWLEELIGLAESGGSGLEAVKEIYREAYARREELCAPYATVIAIDAERLPSPDSVAVWSAAEFTDALRHDPAAASYSPDLRQLLHVGFKIAAQMGSRYTELLQENEAVIARNVQENLYARHMVPLFLEA